MTHGPANLANGILIALGANYREVGFMAGELAASVLDGADTTKIPVENVVPELLAVNLLALEGLKDPWKIPPDVLARADVVRDKAGIHETGRKAK